MPAYANILLLCAGLAAALPAPHHHGHKQGWRPKWRLSTTTSSTTPTQTPSSSAAQSVSSSSTTDFPFVLATTTTGVKLPDTTTVVVAPSASGGSVVPDAVTTAAAAAASAAAGSVWQPTAGTSWQIILNTKLDATKDLTPDVEVFDIDMFGNDASTMATLRQKGKRVICYFSAGSYEPYRPDSNLFQASDLGSVMDGWPDEKWLDIRSQNVRKIMVQRIQLAKQKGCDAVDPDNVDGYNNVNGLGLTQGDALDYVKFLAKTAADNNLSIGLKNAGALVPSVAHIVNFSVNEQCHQYSECKSFQPFIAKNKPVFNIEYPTETNTTPAVVRTAACSASNVGDAKGFSTVIKNLNLDGYVLMCDASVATTATTS